MSPFPSLAFALPLLFAGPQDAGTISRITPEVRVVDMARPAVVYIETDVVIGYAYDFFRGERIPQKSRSSGTGVVIFDDGYIVTNFHVVRGAEEIRVRFDPITGLGELPARLISHSEAEDLALLKIDADHTFPTVRLGTSEDLMVGERVIAIGNPYGQTSTVSAGIISGLHRDVSVSDLRFNNLIQTDASINRGNSGGPLLNIFGELIGINTAMNALAENIGFAIPVDRVREVMEEHLLSPNQASAWLGFDVDLADLTVRAVAPGSPAAAAGVREGDRLSALDGKQLASPDDYRLTLLSLSPDRSVDVQVDRAGARQSLKISGWSRRDQYMFQRLGFVGEEISVQEDTGRRLWRVRLRALRPNGPAESLGLREGDVLDAVQPTGLLRMPRVPREADNWSDLLVLTHSLPAGTQLEVQVWRDDDGDGVLRRHGEERELYKGVLRME